MAASEPAPRIERSGSDILLLYTGGTTGLPKGVIWGHQDLWGALAFSGYVSMGLDMPESAAEVGRIAAELNDGGRSPVNLCAPPLMHGTALFLAIQTFVLGGTVVLLGGRRFDADELLRLVERERVTQISLVGDAFARPIVAALAAAEAAGRPYDLSSVQRVVSTGATFSADSKRGLTSRQPMAILDMIGASEGGPYAINMTLPGQDPGETAAFTATPNTVLFDDVTWERLPPGSGRTGVLAVAGAMPRGYLKDDKKTAATFREIGGVRYTVPGDYAQIDADGTVHLLGRGSVCINTGGEKVYPEEVEVAARTHPGVADCNAVGVPDERFGEAVALVVARAPGQPAVTEAEVIAAVRERLAAYKAPKVVVFVDEIVRSPAGKADYRWARSVAADAAAGGGLTEPSGRDVEQLGVAAQVGGHLLGWPVARQEDQPVDADVGEGPHLVGIDAPGRRDADLQPAEVGRPGCGRRGARQALHLLGRRLDRLEEAVPAVAAGDGPAVRAR